MEPSQLNHLSVSELRAIEKCIQAAMEQKNNAQLKEAKEETLSFIRTHFPDIYLADLLKTIWMEEIREDLTELSQVQAGRELIAQSSQIAADASTSISEDNSLIQTLSKLVDDLKSRHDELISKENTRLLWLMNNGRQKISRLADAELAHVLQETIDKLEAVIDAYGQKPYKEINGEVQEISQWFECQTGIPLINGIFTVISTNPLKGQSAAYIPKPEKKEPDLLIPLTRVRSAVGNIF